MAIVAASAVTTNRNTTMAEMAKTWVFNNVSVVLSTQGSATNNIPASVVNLVKIEGCTSAVKSDNSAIIPCSPSADGTLLLFGGGASNAPADYTGTFTLIVWGISY